MFFSDEIKKNNQKDIKDIKEFLRSFDIVYDNPERTFVIRDKGEIVATGSVDENILKYFFVNKEYKGQGTTGIIYKSLLNYLFDKGHDSFFVFTRPNNKIIFESLGLKEVYSTEKVSLFEGGFYNYNNWIKKVKESLKHKKGIRGSIVMNCNPMTKGHKYLINQSLKKVDDLIIFVVEEDKSVFPFKDRFNIMKEELKNLDNVELVKGGPYIISQGTFPTYFIKEKDEMLSTYKELEGSIFGDKIAKDLEIDIRFLGSEPEDVVTLAYNNTLKDILECKGIEVIIKSRKELNGEIISASYVRRLLKEGKNKEAYKYLPDSTIDYLKSEKGQKIISLL